VFIGVKLKVEVSAPLATGLPQVKVDLSIFHKTFGHPYNVVPKKRDVPLQLQDSRKKEKYAECVKGKA
jgi:hypothetical protein